MKRIIILLILSITTRIYAQTNTITSNKNEKTSKMINLGFFNMFTSSEFSEPYSAGKYEGNTYYRMPSNSWNDKFYVTLSFDWEFIKSLNLRIGWGMEFNFAGSGDSEGSADKVEKDTDLAKDANKGEFYANFVCHKVTAYLNFISFPFKVSIIDFYAGIGGGIGIGWFTYNEILDKEISEFERPYRRTFVKILPAVKLFAGLLVHISDIFEPLFVETAFKFADEPVMKYSTSEITRYIKFQVSGFMLGAGVRY